jgi:hypothetical protein
VGLRHAQMLRILRVAPVLAFGHVCPPLCVAIFCNRAGRRNGLLLSEQRNYPEENREATMSTNNENEYEAYLTLIGKLNGFLPTKENRSEWLDLQNYIFTYHHDAENELSRRFRVECDPQLDYEKPGPHKVVPIDPLILSKWLPDEAPKPQAKEVNWAQLSFPLRGSIYQPFDMYVPKVEEKPEPSKENVTSASSFSESILLGTDTQTGHEIHIDDTARRSGVYVLGKSGMGKSSLLSSMLIQCANNFQGAFFIDPHEDTISQIGLRSLQLTHVLDVEDRHRSFGINLLSCKDPDDLLERSHTYTRAYNVFQKIFRDERGELSPWLQLVLQYSLYVFIENPGYTLAELPLFLTDKGFREYLLQNVKYKPEAVTFWRHEFDPVQAQAALTRLRILLGDTYISHIIGQETTIDFPSILGSFYDVVILKLSSNLSYDVKKFIGTIVFNELLHAVRNRPEQHRSRQFNIFVDEMHNFVSSDDLSFLITEGRKFGVSFTGAHQERYGQLADNQKIAGATLATINKIFFQLSVPDAQEVAAEVADSPPVEYRRERAIVISKEPVWELLNIGHINPRVQELAQEFLVTYATFFV